MFFCPVVLPLLISLAFPADDAWKTKHAAEWTDAETRQVLTDSPWAAMVTPTIDKKAEQKQGNRGGLGIGIPGMGRRRASPPPAEDAPVTPDEPRPFNVRWESALPIREAELKARETSGPDVDEDHYAIAVYGIPSHLAKDPRALADKLKGQASLKRDGQKDLKPSSVDVIPRDDGAVVVFLFPKSKEITTQDSQAEFSALIGAFQFTQAFHLDQMMYQGKLEL
ncbi:MAG TPA: hypothetical protein VMT15_02110 [Bryobacteraceae bacterium]|nr:hypothetical protein [Bryobacteraceae bacterium]